MINKTRKKLLRPACDRCYSNNYRLHEREYANFTSMGVYLIFYKYSANPVFQKTFGDS